MTPTRAYPSHPLVGVSALCYRGSDVLLIKRGKQPYLGLWSLPGGLIELGESLQDAVRRELAEETGVIADLDGHHETFDSILRDENGRVSAHFVLTVFRAVHVEGEPIAMDDAADARWAPLSGLDRFEMTPGTAERIRRLFAR
ncbi:NUDIX hydrolase [Roseibium aquae]|uniref:NUDIX hydrolase n=1 Tax=Roseibium aquae TaxID=1323746 RepID=A0A916TL23_9HYPH|nr:NUDIX hydrolase [Roseibium aquae]GGB51700.1 NUDIX hydrolase [Roseibium aquae]